MTGCRTAAIITIGSELVEGLRVDTNTAHVARRLSRCGFKVVETASVGDSEQLLSAMLARLVSGCALVVTTGGLGPTHDDVTRQAAASALGVAMSRDPEIESWLAGVVSRHKDPKSRAAVLTQALVLGNAEVLWPATGTAPGQILSTPAGELILLPGPPREMSEMLDRALLRYPETAAVPRDLGVVGMAESDVQHAAQKALAPFTGITLTVLAKPGDVRVILIDNGAGSATLDAAAHAVAEELGGACYSTSGEDLASATVSVLAARRLTVATSESCTGGLVSAALTDIPGASRVFLGGVVSYADAIKSDFLGVPSALLAQFGAVSEQCAVAMAEGARVRLRADIAVSVTGIAGPDGGTPEKPVGLVWFGVASDLGVLSHQRLFAGGSRESIRARATATALDLLRHHALGR